MHQTTLVGILVLTAVPQVLSKEYYTAAVVEYATPFYPKDTGDQVLINNAELYLQYMSNASELQVDIIVFPEGGLHGHNKGKFIELPSPSDNVAPCNYNTSYHQALVMLSCGARDAKLYAVVNLGEQYFNSTTNRTELYNSNVAFDRNGVVVGRYRKFNPYGEGVTKPATPDHHVIETDFGVTFGMFTCFDIEFLEPAVTLARLYGVRHFVFPHCWISELPFLTALQAQWGWAYSLDVALLAAGCNSPLWGGTGSGIYQGRKGALKTFQTNDQTSRLLVSNVSKSLDCAGEDSGPIYVLDKEQTSQNHTESQMEVHLLETPSETTSTNHTTSSTMFTSSNSTSSRLWLLKDYMDVYQTDSLWKAPTDCDNATCSRQWDSSLSVLNTAELTRTTLCHNALCCDFELNTTSTFSSSNPSPTTRGDDFSQYHYRLVVFDGVRWYGGGLATGGVQVCGVVSCANEFSSSCGLRSDDDSRSVRTLRDAAYGQLYQISNVFQSISIVGNFHYNNTFIYPDLFVTGSGDDFGSLVSSDYFTYDTSESFNNSVLVSLKVQTPIAKLITAAIYSRQFDRDGLARTEVVSGYKHGNRNLYLLCVSILVILNCVGLFSNVQC